MANYIVTHYINKKLKPIIENGVEKYPVYVRVSYGRSNDRIRSESIKVYCTEIELLENKDIIKLKNEEIKALEAVLNTNIDWIKGGLNNIFKWNKREVVDCFIETMLDVREIKSKIINFINSKTGFKTGILYPYIRISNHDFNEWAELIETGIFKEHEKQRILYYMYLTKFVDNFYSDSRVTHQNPVRLTLGEWKGNKAKEKFIHYLEKFQIMKKNELLEITKEFEKQLIEYKKTSDLFE
jgi:hypothetical protein